MANLSALALLVAGLADHAQFVAEAMDDRLHQDYRAGLLPFAPELLRHLREAGAAGSCWSGAGSTMLGLVTEESAGAVAAAATAFLHDTSVPGRVLTLAADTVGLVTV